MHTVEHKKPGDMDVKNIVGDYKEVNMLHYDNNQRKVYYTDIETEFAAGGKIVSVSDPEGFISHVNQTFCDMAGYTREEVLGMPHYILHHPDMPKKAFHDLWQSLKTEGRWEGFVKNLRKDGGYYWVYATIFSVTRNDKLVGYTSSRAPASPQDIAKYSKIYAEMLQAEN